MQPWLFDKSIYKRKHLKKSNWPQTGGHFCNKYAFVYNSLQIHQDLREELAKAKNVAGIVEINRQLKQRCQVKEHLLITNFIIYKSKH